ncbi:MAG: carboxypeptidase regulatory-like domain-containing protein [Armatimonadota bacterium]|nr:MAG: carboxypeptidase regulatory-like domain-containing protein [Armatimonadota bacterium]
MIKRVLPTLAICSIAALLVVGCGGSSGPGIGSIQGYVFGQVVADTGGSAPAIAIGRAATPPAGYEPVQGAVVMVTGSSTIATTDAQGYFRIDDVLSGVQTVSVTKSGYLTGIAQVTVLRGQLVTVGDTLLNPSERKWTILVFLNADNDLDPYGVLDVNEMETVGSSPEVDILVQMDRYSTSPDWTGCRRMRIMRDNNPATITSPVLQDLGEVDMGDWRVLRDFVVWGTTNYPAEHYLVMVWNHGDGWRTTQAAALKQVSPATRSISSDWTSNTQIKITDLPRAFDVHPRVDIVSFDACLMQMAEVAYELRHYGGLVVGSEEIVPDQGYPYQTYLSALVASPTMMPEQLAEEMVTQTLDFYNSQPDSYNYRWLTQSAVALAQMDGVAVALDGFARALSAAMPAYTVEITSARTQAQSYSGNRDHKDLYDFARLVNELVPKDDVRLAAQALMIALDDAVRSEAHGDARPNSHGLAIFVPNRFDYNGIYKTSYQTLELSLNTAWDEWLAVSPP